MGRGRPQGQHGRATLLEGLPVDLAQLCAGLRRDLERECEKEKKRRTQSREPGTQGGLDNGARRLAFCRSYLGGGLCDHGHESSLSEPQLPSLHVV